MKMCFPHLTRFPLPIVLAALLSAEARPLAAPPLKPAVPVLSSRAASADDLAVMKLALEHIEAGKWDRARRLRIRADSGVVRKVIDWHIARSNKSGTDFRELADILDTLRGWPRLNKARARAEKAITSSSMPHQTRIAWLTEGDGPHTGMGALALIASLRATGRKKEADAILRDTWQNLRLPNTEVRAILRKRRTLPLTDDDHWRRADMLSWAGQRSQARLLLPHLAPANRRVIAARLALAERRRGVDWAVRSVPASRTRDPGLLYERARWRRKKGRLEQGIPLLLSLQASNAPEMARGKIWRERNIALRRLVKKQEYAAAYMLAADHGMQTGKAYAEAEWTAGWLALSKLDDPVVANKHFRAMRASVRTPISLARANYWQGRALGDLDRPNEATNAYGRAAAYPFTYYGQLAAEEIAQNKGQHATMQLPGTIAPEAEQIAAFERDEMVSAAIILADLGRMKTFETFVTHVDDRLDTELAHRLLYDLATSYLQPRAALRSAKAGLGRGLIASTAAYPIPELPDFSDRRHRHHNGIAEVENALLIALSRQESEFNPKARSRAGALGMTQMMPRTARLTARKHKIPYRTSWLRDDPAYNLRLGNAHLGDLIAQFDGSYVMALAAYNAGASRVRRWVRDYGDPRDATVDPVDWVESIPFSETRNYVQRVMEALQVYRYRLSGHAVPIRLTEDLRRGRPSGI